MCGRFTLIVPTYEMLAQALGVSASAENAFLYRPRYNIAPTDPHWVLRMRSGARELVQASWGLVPHWSKTAADAARSINARAESVEERPAFRDSFVRRRCVVAADGFFEWQKIGKERHPLWFTPRSGGLLSLAGLDARWIDPKTGQTRRTFTILTTTANDTVRPVHDRMPVILAASDIDTWLHVESDRENNPDQPAPKKQVTDEIRALLRPAPDSFLIATPVSTRVNSVKNDDPACVAPLDDRSAPLELPRFAAALSTDTARDPTRHLAAGETASLFPSEEKVSGSVAGRRATRH